MDGVRESMFKLNKTTMMKAMARIYLKESNH
jgi:hypothetical protein